MAVSEKNLFTIVYVKSLNSLKDSSGLQNLQNTVKYICCLI